MGSKSPNLHSFCISLPHHLVATLDRIRFVEKKDGTPRSKMIEDAVRLWCEFHGYALEKEGTSAHTFKKEAEAPAAPEPEPVPEKAPVDLDEKARKKWVKDYIKKAQRGEK